MAARLTETLRAFVGIERRAGAAPDFRALVGPSGWSRLHPDIRRRFAPRHPAVCYPGRMDLQCSPWGRIFAWAGRLFGAPLPSLSAADARSEVRVGDDGRGGVVWDRLIWPGPGTPPLRVRSTKRLGPGGSLLECVDGGLGMVLDVTEEAGALVFRSRSYFLAVGRWRVPVPAWLTPGRCRVAHIATAPGRFRFELEMVHPAWGTTFRQVGLFDDPQG